VLKSVLRLDNFVKKMLVQGELSIMIIPNAEKLTMSVMRMTF